MAKPKESYHEVRQEDDERKRSVQQILQKSTDFWRRIIVPVEGKGKVTLSYVCPPCHPHFRLKTTCGGPGKTVQPVVRGVRQPVQLEGPVSGPGWLYRAVRTPAR